MGKKNRNPGSRSKQPAAASSTSVTQSATGEAASDSTSADPSVSFSKIMSAYERALDAIKLGSHHKAIKIMKDTCYNREISDQSALIYRFQSIICGKVAKIINDPSKKEGHMKNAIEYARKAAEISPSSLVFAHSYAQLLFDAANDRTEYEQVVNKCERALKISNPIDHEMESLKDDSQPELSTAEIQNDLRRLIQKSNERKNAPEDIQTEKRTNEIKKVTEKTREDIKKHIEAKVAIERMLQGDSSSGSGQRRKSGGHVRKGAGSTSGKEDLVRSYWNSMSIDSKKEFIRIKISDLTFHFGSSKDKLNGFVAEALRFALPNKKTWKFWLCCYCGKLSFPDSESLQQHVKKSHVGNLSPEMQSVLPKNVEDDWIEMIGNYTWKPLDVYAALKMLEDKAKSQEAKNSEEINITESVEVEGSVDASAAVKMLEDDQAKAKDNENSEEANITECVEVEGSLDASAAVKMLEDDQAKAKDTENSEEANITEGVEVEGSLYASAAVKMLEDDQAKAKDTENSEEANVTEGVEVEGSLDASAAVKMLEDDQGKSKDTENSEETNITEVVEVEGSVDSSAAAKVLEDKAKPKDTNKSEETNITHVYDWPLSDDSERAELLEKIPEEFKTLNRRKCLAASHLNNVIEFSMNWIEELATRSKHMNQHLDLSPICLCFLEAPQLREILKFLDALSRACDNCKSPMDDLPDISQNDEIKENIALNEDATCLVLDETLVPEEITPVATDPFLSWMFSGLSCRAELDSFKRRTEYRRPQAMEFVQTLDNECNRLQRLSETKCKQKNYNEILQMVEDICIEGKNFTDPDQQTYGSVLKRRKEELIKGENDAAVHVSDKFELIAITNILEEADAILKLNDNESGEDDEEIIMDICIEIAIEKMKETQALELSKTDAQLLRSMTNVKELELKLGLASGFDFRETLLPIVKLYLRTRLEDLAMKDATNKSDAAAQAFLAELDLEASQQGVAKSQESDKKPKDKGKKKQKGKTENLKKKKAKYDHEQPIEDIGYSSGVPVHDDDKVKDHAEKQEEDELGLRVKELEQETTELLRKLQNPELGEEEERKLTEELNQKLELQTQVANEASLMQQGWQQV